MLLKYIFLLFCFSLFYQGYGQQHGFGLDKKGPDTATVINLVIEASNIRNTNNDSAMILAEQGLSLSRRLKYIRGEALCLNLAGYIFSSIGQYPKALETFLQALKIAEGLTYSRTKSSILINIGDLYSKQLDYRKALDYTFRANSLSEESNDTSNMTINLVNIGNYYEQLNLLDSARVFTNRGYEMALKTNDTEWIGIALNNLGNIQYKMKHYSLAHEYYLMSLPYYEQEDVFDGIAESTLGIAKIFQQNGNLDSTIYYATLSLNKAKEGGFTNYILSAALFLTDVYKKQNKIDSAFAYQQMMIAAKDSLFSQEKVKQVQSLTLGETIRQQELAEVQMKAIQARKNNLQYMAIAVFIFLFMLFIIVIGKRRTKSTTINFMITVAMLLFFEYLSLLIHPYIDRWTNHTPVYMLLILVVVAAILAPLHHKAEHWVKGILAHRVIHPKTKKIVVKKVE